eukprot:TRINITY_DN2314_c1_g2_i1.p1 TRINITY_DN2314_c1_g2~~TRINITY_DN2314_c1_g2_i1.p1  ORF type:complete len:343 (-),score=10.37 TRINITY_DN2314_c1_g2_i1:366-1394(-)
MQFFRGQCATQCASLIRQYEQSTYTSVPKILSFYTQFFQHNASQIQMRSMANMPPERLKYWKEFTNTPGCKNRVTITTNHLWKGKPFKQLCFGVKKYAGRDGQGRIAMRYRGGGHRKKYRIIDFWRPHSGVQAEVERLEYDPNRSARIALIRYERPVGFATYHSYIIAPQGLGPGDKVTSALDAPISVGNCLQLSKIPPGIQIHNIELHPGNGGQLCRAAGTYATLLKNQDNGYTIVRLPSGEVRILKNTCKATIGQVSNPLHKSRKLGKAGIGRWLGHRPVTRGRAMNVCDHPHGGSTQGRPSCSWKGEPNRGKKTRRKTNESNKFILVSRFEARKRKRGY